MNVLQQRAAPPRRRQADTEASSSASADSATASDPAATTSSDSAASEDTSSITSSASLSGAIAEVTTGPDGPKTVFQIFDPPQFTKTVSTAYIAPGVNATRKAESTTPSHTTAKTTSSSSSTSDEPKYTDPAKKAAESAKGFGIPKNELTACQINGTERDNGPFCSPKFEQNMWAGFTYAITWNPSLFAHNATNTAELRYLDESLGSIWTSDATPNYKGYVNVEMSKDWLRGADGNSSDSGQNMTLWMNSTPLGGELNSTRGPQLALVVDPHTLPKIHLKNIPGKYGLEVGVPIGIVGAILVFLGICCGIRKNNRHHRSIRGVSKDYMAKRARRRGKGGEVHQLEQWGDSEDQYHDQPLKGGTGNHFRDEIAKQRQEDDVSLKRFPSSY